MSQIEQIKNEIERHIVHYEKIDRNDFNNGELYICQELLSFIESLEKESDKLRYCIEYINPRIPLLEGRLNIRHIRVPDEHWAEMMLTVILSFGSKIYKLYRGNVKDGKLADWNAPMIVDEEDWFTDEWLMDLLDCGHFC